MIQKLKLAFFSRLLKKIPYEYHVILSKYNEYYRDLNPSLQKVFRERVFLSSKFITFKPVQFSATTLEMRILITSALVQITFGLNKFIMSKFKVIFVVPNTYSFEQYPALLGHVDHDKEVIVMSWPSVKKGFIIPDDAMNVALHELAHALQGENKERFIFSKFFETFRLKNFEVQGFKEIYKIREKRHPFLRDYAGQNIFELFAVSIECFFEQSEEFKLKVPKLFNLLAELLNQDPTKKSNPIVNKNLV